MTRPISEYTLADWKRLRPLTHGIKTTRYKMVDRLYRMRSPRVGNAAAISRTLTGRKVLFTVAFEDAEAIDWQSTLVRHFIPEVLHIIIDNSIDDRTARDIETISLKNEIAYLRTPINPWPAPSRSHGIALNWVWHNLARPGEPQAFGFLDDDLFPTALDDPFEPLTRQEVFGAVRSNEKPHPERWFLWAGFTMMRFSAVRQLALDFGQDWFLGLDTGGGNWRVLYRHLDLDALAKVPQRDVPYRNGIETHQGPFQWFGSWLHEVGQVGQPAIMADKRRVLRSILEPHLQAARSAHRTGQC